jgi:hypothetical protein
MNHLTYILTPYEPIREIKQDDLTSYHVLLECSKNDYPNLATFNQNIFDRIGSNNTVYGIQKNLESDELNVEYYFYTHSQMWQNDHLAAWKTIRDSLSENIDEHLNIDIPVNFHLGMFSIDIPKNEKKISDVDIYVMEPKKGECLRWNQNGIFRKNKYSFFYDPQEVEEEMVNRDIPNACLLFGNYGKWKESICISLKREKVWSIYYCQVRVETLLLFLKRFNYPQHIIDYFQQNIDKLDHMLFDFGYDFDLMSGGMMHILRGGFYGYF